MRETATLAGGCFWCLEAVFDRLQGVSSVESGYIGGKSPKPTYEDVCGGRTGHAEAVLIAYDGSLTTPELLFKAFWENHDPTQGYRQGNDAGTQYRSAIYTTTPEQELAARSTLADFQPRLTERGFGTITTEIRSADEAGPFYYAEGYHQQYLDKNPAGYCPVHATGASCPRPTGA